MSNLCPYCGTIGIIEKKCPGCRNSVLEHVTKEQEKEEARKQMLNILTKHDHGSGVPYETLQAHIVSSVGLLDDTLFSLLMDSRIFEPRPGRYRLLSNPDVWRV